MISREKISLKFGTSLIKKELSFCLDFIPRLKSKESFSIFIFGLLPYFSLFRIETYKYLDKKFFQYLHNFPIKYDEITKNSRMRIKFFDDTINQVDGVIEFLDSISDFFEDWFINSHTGYLSSLKKALQPDLGIFVYDGHIIGSTHTGLFLTGLEENHLYKKGNKITEDIGQILHQVGKEMGAYFSYLSSFSVFAPIKINHFNYNLDDHKFGYQDVKAVEFLPLIFNQSKTISMNISLLLFLSQTNLVYYILNKIFVKKSDILFKIKFITLYHVVSSLYKLQSYCYRENVLTEFSQECFRNLFQDKDLKQIKSKTVLRNILVHYELQKVPDNLISHSLNFKKLVEYCFDGESFAEIVKKIDKKVTYHNGKIKIRFFSKFIISCYYLQNY